MSNQVVKEFLDFDNIPKELRMKRQWVLADMSNGNDGKPKKCPCNEQRYSIDATSDIAQKNWKTFDEIKPFLKVGSDFAPFFVFNNDYVGFDIDSGIVDNKNKWWVENIFQVHVKNPYIEISPSKTGFHIIYKISSNFINISGKNIKLHTINEKFKNEDKKCGIEIYAKNRGFVFTGNVYKNYNEINQDSKTLTKLYETISGESLSKKVTQMKKKYSNPQDENIFKTISFKLHVKDIIEKYYETVKKKGVVCPFHGDTSPSLRINMIGNYYNCFGCDAGGDGIDFVSRLKNISQIEAAKLINDDFKLDLDFSYTEIHPDFKKVKWNKDFVLVTYKDQEEGQQTIRLSEYNNKFNDVEKKPKMNKFHILQVRENVIRLLAHYGYSMKFNIVKDNYEVFKDDKYYEISLDMFSTYFMDMGTKHNFNLRKEKTIDILKALATENKYNPIENYLKNAHTYYLSNPNDNIFNELADTIISDSFYKKKFLSKFLLQMVWLICCDDKSKISAQYMLVLQGEQGIGKTTWFKNLMPDNLGTKYFLGGRLLDPGNKDHIMETIDNWLVEMGEISSTFRKADQENLKNFITAQEDRFRRPYDKLAINKKRRTTLCGTTNDIEYLRDLTGSRRFLTLNCIDIDWKREIDIDMLWGFIYDKYLKKVTYAFTHDEEKEIMKYNQQYLNKPESLMLLEEYFILNPEIDEGDNWMSSKEIFDKIGFNTVMTNHFKLGKELKRFGVQSKRHRTKRTVYNVRLKRNF